MNATLPILLGLLLAPLVPLRVADAADLVLLGEGKSDYEIVVPDRVEKERLTECLNQTARLVQTAFEANGAEMRVVRESERDPAKPALFLGDTGFARRHGVDVTALRDWSYVHRVVGKDVIVAGHDHPARGETANRRRPNWDRVGTAKAAVDFVRQYAGVRFLYPDIAPYNPVAAAANVDLLASPAIEFLPMETISVPAELNTRKTPVLRLNTAHPAGGGFYDLAHNRFPRVDPQAHRWHVLVTIPFKTLAAELPAAGITWRVNFARNHHLPRGKIDRATWSPTITSASMDDRSLFGEIVFQ